MLPNVRYSNAAYQEFHDKSFSTQKDAGEFAERLLQSYRYIWLSEFGDYRTAGGNWVRDWIVYWWSAAVTETEWGECPDPGWGRPAGHKYLREYRPIVFRSKKRAHLNVRICPTGDRAQAPSGQRDCISDNAQGSHALVGVDSG